MPTPDDFQDRDAIADALVESGVESDAADRVAREIEREAGHDLGDPAGLFEAVTDAAGMIADGALDLVSGVDVPAIDSKWVMLKSDADDHDWRTDAPILLSKADTDDRVGFAPAMIPRQPDKEGEVVSTPTVEGMAHQFIKDDGGIDTDHSLIEGDGEPVESWLLKDDRTFDLPGGGEETYPAGTWMLGVEWTKEAWDRIQSGELSGLSIYGQAERVALSTAKQAGDFPDWAWSRDESGIEQCKQEMADEVADEAAFCFAWAAEAGIDTANSAADGGTVKGGHGDMSTQDSPMSDNPDADGSGDASADSTADGGDADGPTLKDLHNEVGSVAEAVESLKDAVETEKQDAQEAAAILGDEMDMPPGDVLDVLDAAAGTDADQVLEAIESIENATDEDEDDEDDEDMDQSADAAKDADETAMHKGHGRIGEGTREGELDADDTGVSGIPSYLDAAEGDD